MLFAITIHFQHDLHNSKRTLNYFIYPTEKIISFSHLKIHKFETGDFPLFQFYLILLKPDSTNTYLDISQPKTIFIDENDRIYILGTAEIVFISYLVLPIML